MLTRRDPAGPVVRAVPAPVVRLQAARVGPVDLDPVPVPARTVVPADPVPADPVRADIRGRVVRVLRSDLRLVVREVPAPVNPARAGRAVTIRVDLAVPEDPAVPVGLDLADRTNPAVPVGLDRADTLNLVARAGLADPARTVPVVPVAHRRQELLADRHRHRMFSGVTTSAAAPQFGGPVNAPHGFSAPDHGAPPPPRERGFGWNDGPPPGAPPPNWDGPPPPGGWNGPPPPGGWNAPWNGPDRDIALAQADFGPFSYNGFNAIPVFNPVFGGWGFWFFGTWIPLY